MARPKSGTADEIIVVAEQQFAERGYQAASMGDIAREVGIRTPSLYSHFRNKAALYEAVLERRLSPLLSLVQELGAFPASPDDAIRLLRAVMQHYLDDPTLARLLQYAVLSGGEQHEILMQRVFRPLFRQLDAEFGSPEAGGETGRQARLLVAAFHSMIVGYVNLAPIYGEMMQGDALGEHIAAGYMELLMKMAEATRPGRD